MKNSYILTLCGMMAFATANSQNLYDMSHLMGSELNGTARFVGMGGAMSALGGDISVINSNPAGIGIFRSSDFSTSFGLNSTSTESKFNGTKMNEDKSQFTFDQIGFVYSNKIGNNTSLRYVNFAFNYHKDKNFNRLFSAGGALNNMSQSWQIAQEMSKSGLTTEADFNNLINTENPYSKYWSQYPVLGILGAKTGVIDWVGNTGKVMGWDGYNNNYYSKETGGIDEYDFNVAFNIEDQFYLGLTVGVYDVNYKKYSSYTENLNDDYGKDNGGYTLDNYYKLSGTGVDLKLGMIVRPFVDSPFRLGLSVTTPTWYDLRESFNATLSSDIYTYPEKYSQTLSDYLDDDYLNYDFNFRTPWVFNLSAGTTVSNVLALGAEYEYEDYSSGKLTDMDGYELGGNYGIKEYLKGVSTLKLGMEAKLMPQFSVRAGYNYTTAAFKSDAYYALDSYNTRTDFNNTKEKNTFTFGLGYKGNMFYADLAYKYDVYKSDFYAFDDLELPKTNVTNSRNQVLLTMGVKF